MASNNDLIRRLCEASEGSADLSAEVWTALTGAPWRVSSMAPHTRRPIVHSPWVDSEGRHWSGNTATCVTTDISATWEAAESRGYRVHFMTHDLPDGRRYKAVVRQPYPPRNEGQESARTPALAICAALLAAEGER